MKRKMFLGLCMASFYCSYVAMKAQYPQLT